MEERVGKTINKIAFDYKLIEDWSKWIPIHNDVFTYKYLSLKKKWSKLGR